jgi:NAD(P)-dependent dehydrogenase (short-subunit alcohol dehydrogenase family)
VIGIDIAGAELSVDLSEPLQRQRMHEDVAILCNGRLDSAILCAGISGFTDQSAAAVVSVNYFGAVEVLSALRPLLAAGLEPAAIAVSSVAAITTPGVDGELINACLAGNEELARDLAVAIGGPAAYAASKFALARWVRQNAPKDEWIGCGIPLNAIAPGEFNTPMTRAMQKVPEAAEMMRKMRNPAGRPGSSSEIVDLVAFLIGPGARYIVGSFIVIDGGTDAAIRGNDWPSPRMPTYQLVDRNAESCTQKSDLTGA